MTTGSASDDGPASKSPFDGRAAATVRSYDGSVVDFDSAFLWESEALRSSSPRRARTPRHSHRDPRDDATWVTLREGHGETGVPVSTLRKWAMGGNVATYMQETPVGQVRMVSLQGIYKRAEELGREISGRPPAQAPIPAAPRPAPRHSPRPAEEPEVPPGTTLVPLDAWNKMLLQLGNLHEAGQQLAEASARAAKAETEAAFLKERLAEMREELARSREGEATPPPQSASAPPVPGTGSSSGSLGVIRQVYQSWRGRGRR